MLPKLLQFVIVAFAGTSLLFAQPKMEIVGGDSYNWGDVKPSESPLKTRVQLKNVGNQELVIQNVKPSCGCTTSKVDKDKLKPGEVANIDVSFNVGANPGVNSKTIRITTNEPSNNERIYRLSANVVKNLIVAPTTYFLFDKMQVGNESTTKLTLRNNGSKDITMSDFEVTPNNFKINMTGRITIKPGQTFDLVGKVTPVKSGPFNCTVKMKTTDPETAELTISGYGSVEESPLFNNK